MDNQQGRTVGIDFLAGLIVGEGSFILGVHKLRGDKIRIKPAFSMQMNDGETMQLAYESMKQLGIGAHLHHRPERGCWTLQVAGFERMKTLILALLPSLTGTKWKAAKICLRFIYSRQEKSPQAPYSAAEYELVRQLRATNGNPRGRKNPL